MNRKNKRFLCLGLASLLMTLASCQTEPEVSSSEQVVSSMPSSTDSVENDVPSITHAQIKLLSPSAGEEIQITPTPLINYIKANNEADQIEAISKAKEAENKNLTCTSVKLSWGKDGSANYTIYLADNEQFENAIEAKVSSLSSSYSADNLIPNSTYYWKVKGTKTKDTSNVSTFKTLGTSVRFINAGGAYNIRDLGGWKAGDKTIRYGKLFRGGLLNNLNGWADLDENGKKVFNETLKVQTEIDLRITGKDDGEQKQCAFDPNKKYIQAQLGQYNRILDPDSFAATNGHDSFGDMVLADSKNAAANDGITVKSLREIFATLSDEAKYPIYFHCNAGADRTGTLAFLIEGLLGVSYEDTIRDFELTSFSKFGERLRSKIDGDHFDESGVYMNQAGNNYIAFGEMYNDIIQYYGDGKGNLSLAIENYLTRYVNVPSSQIAKVREILLGEEKETITLSNRQEFSLENETISLNLGENSLDSISSISLGNINLGKDPANISLKTIKNKDIAGEREIVIEGKKGEKDVTIYAPILLITKIINTKEEFIALDTYRAKTGGKENRVINFGYYRLAKDIGTETSPISHGGYISDQHNDNGANGFRGTIDGDGHTVYLNPSYGGLFSVVGGGAVLKNINFTAVKFGSTSGNFAVTSILGPSLCGAVIENASFNCLADGYGKNYQNCLFASGGGFISSNIAHCNYFKNVTVNSASPLVSLFGGVTYEGFGGCKFENFVINCDQLGYIGIKRTTSTKVITLDNCVLPMEIEGITGDYKAASTTNTKVSLTNEFITIDVGSKYGSMALNKAAYNGKVIEGAVLESNILMFEREKAFGANPSEGNGNITLSLEKDGLTCSYSLPITLMK